jgi:hypothetical protein
MKFWSLLNLSPDLSWMWLFFGDTGVWTPGLTLARQDSTTWAAPPLLFYVGYFWDRVSRAVCPNWPQTVILHDPCLQSS